jgi:hypothetical protein
MKNPTFTPTAADMPEQQYGVLFNQLGEDGDAGWVVVGTPGTPVTVRRALAAVHWFTRTYLCGVLLGDDADIDLHDDLASGRWTVEACPSVFVRDPREDCSWIGQPVDDGTPGAVPAVWIGGAW